MAKQDTSFFPLLIVTCNTDLKELTPILEKAGFAPSFSEDVGSAKAFLEKSPCHIIVFDRHCLAQDPKDLFPSLKIKYSNNSRQLILVETADDAGGEPPGHKFPVDDVIPRPLDPTACVFRINRAKRVFLLEKALKQTSHKMKQGTDSALSPQSLLSQNLETLGRLAAGVIHEINTPVQYVGDNLHFLLDGLEGVMAMLNQSNAICEAVDQGHNPADSVREFKDIRDREDLDYLISEIPESIRQSIQGVERISEIVLAIRNFSSQSQDDKQSVDVQAAVKSCALVTKNQWKKNADLKWDISPDLPEARISPGAFNQVLINMIINASHAVEEACESDPDRKGLIRITARLENGMIILNVSDNGSGIPESALSKIFDPFFTTKKEGKGTGQGLAISKSIIEKNQGQLTVKTEPGKGTDFVICLLGGNVETKTVSTLPTPVVPREIKKQVIPDGERKLRFLFVDDEIEILNGIQRMLRNMQGVWDMNFTQNGLEALKFLEENPVNVVVSDFSMKGMNGLEFLTQVKDKYPQTIRIMLSGEINKSFIMKTVRVVHQFIAKPTDAETLKTAITRACDLQELLVNDDLRRTVADIDSLPSLPTVYAEITKELRSHDASMKKVGQLIGRDTAMTTKILQLVNSAFFSLPKHISSPEQAVLMLGFDTVKALVLHYEIFSKINVNKSFKTFLEVLSRHNMETGNLAKQICDHEKSDPMIADQAFMAGLLHDCGKLVLASNYPKEYSQVFALAKEENHTLLTAEREVFGTTHSEVGAYLTGIWGFPLPLMNAIFHHHDPEKIEEQNMGPETAVYVANLLSRGSCVDINGEFLNRRGFTDRVDTWKDLLVTGE